MKNHTPGPWSVYDPCYGACPVGAMPCTPDGCHENHPVGMRAVRGPSSSDGGDIEFMSEADASLVATAPDLLEMLEEILADREAWQIGKDTRDRARRAIAKAKGEC